jgi:hypothetical protein
MNQEKAMSQQESIIISSFCKRRDQAHCRVPLEELVAEIHQNWDRRKEGYREGVVLVPVDPGHFAGRLTTLREGDKLEGAYRARIQGEEPRKTLEVACVPWEGSQWIQREGGQMRPAVADPVVAADAVLYHRSVLEETGEHSREGKASWEVITFLTKISHEDQPMPVETLLHNHFGASGGTATGMGAAAFEKALKKSFVFWKDKGLLPPVPGLAAAPEGDKPQGAEEAKPPQAPGGADDHGGKAQGWAARDREILRGQEVMAKAADAQVAATMAAAMEAFDANCQRLARAAMVAGGLIETGGHD